MDTDDVRADAASGSGADLTLPADFEKRAVLQMDKLIQQKELFYADTKGEVVEDNGFKIEFRASPSITKKPILARDAPERRGQGGPFLNPDPAFVVAELGDSYIVELSKYAMYRPHYVLHTRHFAPQTDDLDIVDFTAAAAVMFSESYYEGGDAVAADVSNGRLATTANGHSNGNGVMTNGAKNGTAPAANGHSNGNGIMTPPARLSNKPKKQRLLIYNCGYDAGASQGHKHTQVFEIPDSFPLFPSKADSTERISSCIPHVPFRHFAIRLRDPSPHTMLAAYRRLLAEVRLLQEVHGLAAAYNVAATAAWMCLVPRRRGGLDGTGANAAGMLGVIWVRDAEERRHWAELGPARHLAYLGVPKDERKFSTDHRD